MSLLRKYIRYIILEHDGEHSGEWDYTDAPSSGTNKSVSIRAGDDDEDGPPDDLLTEPDFIEDPEEEGKDARKDHDSTIRKEISAISTGGGAMTSTNAIGGVTTPLGTGPTYPAKKKKKKRKKKGKYPTYGTLSSDD